MRAIRHRTSPRNRILNTAIDLFYRQGYGATGVNQIIREANVAKASFYDHFPSKDDLFVAYLTEISRREIADIRREIQKEKSVRARFFVPLASLGTWLEATDFRGCPFQNAIAEAPPDVTSAQSIVWQHREALRTVFTELARDLQADDPALQAITPEALAAQYQVIFEGAIALCVAYRDPWPADKAIQMLEGTLPS